MIGAQEEILILDWWLSPELYLRRPPSKNEEYRVDNMLKAAAERGVKVHIIVYKEVEAALTCNSRVSCHIDWEKDVSLFSTGASANPKLNCTT